MTKKELFLTDSEMKPTEKKVSKFLKGVYGGVTGTGRRLSNNEHLPVLLGKVPREKGLPFFCAAVGPDFVNEWLPDRVTMNFFRMYETEDGAATPFVIQEVQAFNVSKETFKTFWHEWDTNQISVYPSLTKAHMVLRVYPRGGGGLLNLSVHLTPLTAAAAERPARVQRNDITFPGYPDKISCATYLIRDGETPAPKPSASSKYMSAPMPDVDPQKKVQDLSQDEIFSLCYAFLKGNEESMRKEKTETGAETTRKYRKFRRDGDTTYTIVLQAKSDWRAYGK